jgi:hypothetical protein
MTDPSYLQNYGDEALEELRVEVANEVERRQRLASSLVTINQVARQFLEAGGSPAELASSLPETTPDE